MRKNAFGDHLVLRGDRTILGILLFGIILLSLLAIPATAAKLATPVTISPANNQHFYDAAGLITFAWKPVTGITQYKLEIQQKSGALWIPWGIWTPSTNYAPLTVLFPGTYRWRVIAQNGVPADESNPSAWRTFDFSMNSFKLATPVLLSPASGTTFYHNNFVRRVTLSWKPVPGADAYSIEVEYMHPVTKQWTPAAMTATFGSQHTGCNIDFIAATQGRWRVTAGSLSTEWLASNPSPWRTFTFKV